MKKQVDDIMQAEYANVDKTLRMKALAEVKRRLFLAAPEEVKAQVEQERKAQHKDLHDKWVLSQRGLNDADEEISDDQRVL